MIQRLRHALTGSGAIRIYLLIALIIVVTCISPRFFSAENFFDILFSASYNGIISIGFLVVLICGGMDISFYAVATVAQYFMGLVLINIPDIPWPIAILLPLVLGTLLGCLNAILIHKLKAPPFIITIANMNIFYGLLQFISKGTWLYNFPKWFSNFPHTLVLSFVNENGVSYGLKILTVIWFLVAVVTAFILNRTKTGRSLYAMGGNIEAASRVGINLFRNQLFAYGFLGFTAGLGGIVHTFITQTVAANTLVGHEFDVVAAVVLGGASLFGGTGTVGGAVIGVVLIAVLSNALTIMQVPQTWYQVFIGVILIASMATTVLSEKNTMKKVRSKHVE